MIDWGQIKQEIISQTKNVFTATTPDLESIVNLFISVINFDINEKTFNGVKDYYPNVLQKILVDDDIEFIDKCSCFPVIGNIEGFCRKLTFLLAPDYYKSLDGDKTKGLSSFISFLGLNSTTTDSI